MMQAKYSQVGTKKNFVELVETMAAGLAKSVNRK